ncbi:DUF7507 domain-containing protein [Nakamurella lactea]|uniref:DUF7507 domain-containing protein n=1 Tax=Nakamurella lactea TaxID=459515 RepID=UPI0004128311|nr:LPXTG cell wall anchor domain-containing protein [Nakamurella lactea]
MLGSIPARRVAATTASIVLIAAMATAVAPAALAAPADGTLLLDESFTGTSAENPNIIPLNDACLTAATTNPPPGGSAHGPCTKRVGTPANDALGGWLQHTDRSENAKGGIVYNQALPANAGLQVEFSQWQYGGGGIGPADGISFFLVDGAVDLDGVGAFGGSLGYAQKDAVPGVNGGYLGVGLDAYGNFANDSENRGRGCPADQRSPVSSGTLIKNAVVIRGPMLADRDHGYCYLAGTVNSANNGTTLPGTVGGTSLASSRRDVRITVSPDVRPTVTVEMDFTGTRDHYQTVLSYTMTTPAPATWKFGFAASTGGGTDVHLIRTPTIETVDPLPPGINLVKQVDRSQTQPDTYTAGDTVPYQFVVTNTALVPLNDVKVTDPKVTDIACPADSLGPAGTATASMTCTGSHRLTDADTATATEFSNTATATGSSGGEQVSATSSVTVPITVEPRIVIDKSAELNDTVIANNAADVGETVTYSFAVTNAGNVPLSTVGVTDSKVGAVACPVSTLAPLARTTCTATYTVTQADVDAGVVHNSATAHGTPPVGGPVVSDPATADVPTTGAMPAITLTKTATLQDTAGGTTGLGDPGEHIGYSFTVTNRGNVTLTGVVVADARVGTVSCPDTTLAPGESTTCSATDHVIDAADVGNGFVINTATASGRSPAGDRVVSRPASAVVPTVVANPQLTIVKTATLDETTAPTGDGQAAVGDTISYSYLVHNTGNVDVAGVAVADDPLGAVACGSPAPTLAPGDEVTCAATSTHTVTQADLDHGSVDNSATAHGTSGATIVVSLPDTASVPAQQQAPQVTIVKSAELHETEGDTTDGLAVTGDTVDYTFLVTNTGNVTLAAVGVSDSKVSSVSCPATALAPGADTTCTGTYSVTDADVDAGAVLNTATAHGTPPGGTDPIESAPDNAVVPALRDPGVTIEKTATLPGGATVAAVGDLVTYTFAVTNTGTVTLDPLTVTDPMFPGLTGCPATLGAGQRASCTATYTVTQADVDTGRIANTATATGSPPTGGDVTSSDDAVVPTVLQQPAIVLVKSATINDTDGAGHIDGLADLGETVSYGFTVYNTGNVTLSGVAVTDPVLGTVSCAAATLAPQANTTCSADDHTVTEADLIAGRIDNTATATGTPPSGDDVQDTDGKVVPTATPRPSIVLAKAAALDDAAGAHDGLAEVGETISYTFTVTNNGNLTVSGIAVDDPVVGAVSCTEPAGGLAPAASMTCTSDEPHTVTQADVDHGSVDNTATADAFAPGDQTPSVQSNEASASVPTVPQVASIALTKKVLVQETLLRNGIGNLGENVRWTFAVVNTGNVTLHDIAVSDATAGVVACDATTLAPGETTACHSASGHPVDEADILAGSIDNTATVTGAPPTGESVTSRPASASLPTAKIRAKLFLIKRATLDDANDNGWGDPGETISYRFLVINIGNVTIKGVHVDDTMFGGAVACTPQTLPPARTVLQIGPDQTATCGSHVHRITAADAAYGYVHNEARALGTDPNDAPVRSRPATQDVLVRAPLPPGHVELTKSVDVATAAAGDTVHYTLTLTNTGGLPVSTTVSDDLSDVLDDAAWNDDATATAGSLTFSPPELSWTGTVTSGQTVTIRYSVTVNASAGDFTLDNVARVDGGTCADSASACYTTTVLERELPNTGGPFSKLTGLALGLLLAGAALMVVGRRRRQLG